MKLSIVVPTYNEKENVHKLVEAVFEQGKKLKNHELHLVFADSASPDGTADIVKDLAKKNPRLHVVVDTRRGIGIGLLTGMAYAFDTIHSDAVVCMDADFSHDPGDIPRLAEKFDQGYDVVIGSRYMKGGGTKNWGFVRKWGSFFVNLYIRIMLGVKPTEITTNFRLFSKKVWQNLDKDRVPWTEKSFLTTPALLYFVLKAVPNFAEIPILFVDRTDGYSKAQLYTYARAIFIFSLKERKQVIDSFFKFLFIGLTGVVVNLLTLFILVQYFHLLHNSLRASILGTEFSIISNFFLNNSWTFKNRKSSNSATIRFIRYNIIASLSALVTTGIFWVLTNVFGVHYLIAQFVGIAFATPLTFLSSIKWAWKR